MNYIVYKLNGVFGEIIRTGFCSDSMFSIQGNVGELVIEGTANDSTQYILDGIVTDYTTEQLAIKNNLPYGYVWDIATMSGVKSLSDEEINTYLSYQIKKKRNTLLSESIIWTDTSYTGDVLQAWLNYRKALKDIPNQPGYPTNVIWPVKPS